MSNVEALVDTCILADVLRGEELALEFLKAVRPSSLAVSAVTVLELRTPREKVGPPEIRATEKLLARFNVFAPTSYDWARALNLYRDRFKSREPRPKWSDLLIAETARGRNLSVVTRDEADFKLMGTTIRVEVPYRLSARPASTEGRKFCVRVGFELWDRLQKLEQRKIIEALGSLA